jgi:hypothetical protein
MSEKPKKRRKHVKNASLIKKYNPRVRHEILDYDYLDQLSEEELAWLNKFTNEYVNAAVKADDEELIHDYEKHRKFIFDANNHRNTDLYGRAKYQVKDKNTGTVYKLVDYHAVVSKIEELSAIEVEDSYIDYLDHEKMIEVLEEYDRAMFLFSELE